MTGYVGEIRLMPYGFVPRNWLPCLGQTLTAAHYPALWAVLGTTYGGGSTFRLPDLAGKTTIGTGQAAPNASGEPQPAKTATTYQLGQVVGSRTVALSLDQLPAHTHVIQGTVQTAKSGLMPDPRDGYLARADANQYGEPAQLGQFMAPNLVRGSTTASGDNLPHDNLMPYLVLNYCICCEGMAPLPA
jgi:microcystin-dependent protein